VTKFEKKLASLARYRSKVYELEREMTDHVSTHLGDDWYVTYDAGDGILLGSPDAYNYKISTYLECAGMGRDEAIAYIEGRPFN
jgi:hypothetical protein